MGFDAGSGRYARDLALEQLPRSWPAAYERTADRYPDCKPVSEIDDVGAEELGPHRRDYLQYEGEVSGGRGQVTRIATGTYSASTQTPDEWQISLAGDTILRLGHIAPSGRQRLPLDADEPQLDVTSHNLTDDVRDFSTAAPGSAGG